MIKCVTSKFLKASSGHSSTPILSDLPVRNGDWLKLGSSEIERCSAERDPEKIERLRFPTWTPRPSVEESCCSIAGRKELALMKKGIAIRMTSKTPTRMPILRSFLFMTGPPHKQVHAN